jgi:hypothetical protein
MITTEAQSQGLVLDANADTIKMQYLAITVIYHHEYVSFSWHQFQNSRRFYLCKVLLTPSRGPLLIPQTALAM